MDTNALSPKVAATTLSSTATHAGNPNLSTDLKRMAVSKVWDAIMRGARAIVRVTGACENTDQVNHHVT